MPYSMEFAKKAMVKIKFKKMKDTFLDIILWLKSPNGTAIISYRFFVGTRTY